MTVVPLPVHGRAPADAPTANDDPALALEIRGLAKTYAGASRGKGARESTSMCRVAPFSASWGPMGRASRR
jgi:hypothetical protein